jgi:hypothetical protein
MIGRLAVAFMVIVVAWSASCGGRSVDPRCVSLCVVTEPDLAGAYDVCSAASAATCKQDCDARIAEVTTVCASCLLEESCFGSDCGAAGSNDACDSSGQCTVTGREGDCTYPQGDQAARDDCLRQVYPRRTVDCTPEFRPVAECSDQCGTGGEADGGG